jgi:hypothetical protein
MVRNWDLSGGAARLELAAEDLKAARADSSRYWHDGTSKRFDEMYLLPLDPKVRRALDAIHRLAEVLGQARRECGND